MTFLWKNSNLGREILSVADAVFPKRTSGKNWYKKFGQRFYIAKKDETGKAIGIYTVFNFDTKNKITIANTLEEAKQKIDEKYLNFIEYDLPRNEAKMFRKEEQKENGNEKESIVAKVMKLRGY